MGAQALRIDWRRGGGDWRDEGLCGEGDDGDECGAAREQQRQDRSEWFTHGSAYGLSRHKRSANPSAAAFERGSEVARGPATLA